MMNNQTDLPQAPVQETPLAFMVLVLSCFLWGSALSFVKIAQADYDPLFLVFIRMLIAFLVLTPLVVWRCWPFKIYSKRDLGLLILLTFCDPIGFFTFESLAMQYTSAAQASMIWALAPLLNALAAWVILKEKTSLPVFVCFFVAIAGVAVLTAVGEDNEHASNPILGNFLELLSLCGAAGFMIILRFLKGRYPALFVVWFQCLGASIVLSPTLFLGWAELPTEFNWGPFMAMLYLAVCVTLGAQASEAYALARISVPRMSAIENSTPVFGVLCGLLILGETLLPMQWAASAAVIGAVLVSQYYQRKLGY